MDKAVSIIIRIISPILIGITIPLALTFAELNHENIIINLIYYNIIFISIIYFLSIKILYPKIQSFIIITSLIIIIFIAGREITAFKITPDEYEISMVAMNLSNYRQAFISDHGIIINNELHLKSKYIDKKPIFFQFLLATVHDIFGYNPNNVFKLNLLITFLLFLSIGFLGLALNGFYGALLALCMAASIPLIAQNATGGGLELFNLLMLAVTLLLAWYYLESPSKETLTALVFSGLLLAQVRYESMLFLIPILGIAVLGALRTRTLPVSMPVAFTPLFLFIPILHLQSVIKNDSWWLDSENISDYLFINTFSGIEYLVSIDNLSSMNGYIGFLAISGLSFFSYVNFRKIFFYEKIDNLKLLVLIFIPFIIINTLFIMSYPWGNFKDPSVSRFSLPLVLIGTLSFVSLVKFTAMTRKLLFGSIAVAFYFITLPAMSNHHYTSALGDAHYLHWAEHYFEKINPLEHYLIIAKKPGIFLVNERQSIIQNLAILRATQVKAMLDRQMIEAVYVVQELYFDPTTGSFKISPGHELGKQYRLEPLTQYPFGIMEIARISKVVEITPDPSDSPRNYPGFVEEARTGKLPPLPVTPEQVREQIRRLP